MSIKRSISMHVRRTATLTPWLALAALTAMHVACSDSGDDTGAGGSGGAGETGGAGGAGGSGGTGGGMVPVCGNGVVEAGEACDDGNMVDTDACTNACKDPACGDGIVGPGEDCEDGNDVDTDACTNACKNAECGDGVVQDGVEQCDDGNDVDTDACLNGCFTAECGDGVVQDGVESCDDGNMDQTDACLNVCTSASCGDGIVQVGVEQCDDGNADNTDACTQKCQSPKCGDGYLQAGEACDDGNNVNGDGCSSACSKGTYYELTGTPDEATAFNTIDRCFGYGNNLANSIWHNKSNTIKTGDALNTGYLSHSAAMGGHPGAPSAGATRFTRFVHMPKTEMVAYSVGNHNELISFDELRLAPIDAVTGVIGDPITPQFSDNYVGTCNVLSSDPEHLLCLENSTTIRRYATTKNSAVLTYVDKVTLGMALPVAAACGGVACFGGTFAWDGKFFYFAETPSLQTNLKYLVYQADGTFVATRTATGAGGLHGLYFDWSVGRYSSHDGYGNRKGGMFYASSGGDSDTHCFGGTSAAHMLVSP